MADEQSEQLKRGIVEALRDERWGEALPLLEAWCDNFPTQTHAWLNRGYCLARLGRFQEAVAAFDRCLELDPSSEKARKWRDQVLAESREETAAVARSASMERPPAARDGLDDGETHVEEAPSPTYATISAPDSGRGWHEGNVIDGRYEVQSTARGGMAIVAIAFDRELRRTVAVKTPLPSVLASADGRTRFQREAESWIALGIHPNICCAYYLQEIGGMPRLFMEYVDGGDLGEWLSRERLPAIEERLDIAVQITSGLEYTHSFEWTDDDGVEHRGVIHRDIKPANVLLTSDGIARLTDFGLVRVEGRDESVEGSDEKPADLPQTGRNEDTYASGSWQTVTVEGGLVGTPPYMAPELWRQALRGTVATDVYAFGCMLYEIVCGRRPFIMSNDPANLSRESYLGGWMRMHLRDDPPDPRQFVEGLNPRLAALMRSCVDKKAARRPQSFSLIRGWLTEIYEEVTGSQYPRPKPERTQLMADSLNNRGVSYVTLDLEDRAGRSFQQALSVDPGHLEATFNAGLLEWRTVGLTDAELDRRIGEAERRHGQSTRAALLRARWRLLVDDPKGAEEAFRTIGDLDDQPASIRRELGLAVIGRISATGERNRLDQARAILEQLVQDSPSDVAAVVALARARELGGEDGPAREMFEHARRLDEDLPETLAESAATVLAGHAVEQAIPLTAPVQSLAAFGGGAVAARTAETAAVVIRRGDPRPGRRIELGGPARQGRSMTLALGGSALVVCLENGPLTLFDAKTSVHVRNLRIHPGVAICVAASPDGLTVATGGSDRCLRLWDLESGECVNTLQGHDAFIGSLAWHPAGDGIFSAGADGTLRFWNVRKGRCERVMEGHRGPVRAVAMSADGGTVLSGGQDGSVGLWDPGTGQNVGWLRGFRGAVTAVTVVDGSVVAGGEDGTVRFWDAADGRSLRVFRVANPIQDVEATTGPRVWVAHGSTVSCLHVPRTRSRLPLELSEIVASGELADREKVFRGHLERALRLMAAKRMDEVIPPLREARAVPGYEHHSGALAAWNRVLAFYPKSAPREIVELRRFDCGGGNLSACTFMRDGTFVAGGSDGTLYVFDPATGSQRTPLAGHSQGVTSIAASFDDRLIASSGRDATVRVWNASEGRLFRELEGHIGAVNCVAMTPGGEVVSAGEDGTIRLWPVEQDDLPILLGSGEESVLTVAASADGRFVVSGGWDSQITVWSLIHKAELRRLEGHEGPVLSVAVSPDSRVIASGGEDGSLRLWDLESGRAWRTLAGHEGAVRSVAFTPDARFLISAGRDATLRVWDARTGASAKVVEGHADTVVDLAVDASGGSAISVGSDSSIAMWFLDWDPEQPERDLWDDRVRPFLKVFLRRREQEQGSTGIPTWTDTDLKRLLEDLGRRGFGWLAPNRVEHELEQLARNRDETRTQERQTTRTLVRQRQQEVKAEPAKQVIENVTRNLGLKIGGGVLAVILVVMGLASLRTPQPELAELNHLTRAEIVRLVDERSMRMRRGSTLSYQEEPTISDETCLKERMPLFVDYALNAERQHNPPLDPGAPCDDPVFRKVYADSIRCAGVLGDRSVASSIIERADGDLHPYRLEDFVTVLVGIGQPAEDELRRALVTHSESARHLAAVALVHSPSPTAAGVLLDTLRGDNTRGVEAASFVLTELVALGVVDESSAFDTVQRLCRNIDPRVRANSVRALMLFERSGPAAELIDEMLADNDPDVILATERTVEMMRNAKIQQIFGPS